MKKFALILVFAVLLTVMFTGCQTLGSASDTGNNFMSALKSQDYSASYAMLAPELQTELGGQDGWKSFAEPRNFSEWKFTNTQVSNDSGQMDGEATLGDEVYNITLILQKSGDDWKVAGIDISFKEKK